MCQAGGNQVPASANMEGTIKFMDEQTYGSSDASQVIIMNKEHIRVGFLLHRFCWNQGCIYK